MNETPTFGQQDPKAQYILRPSVYGILRRRDGQIAVIELPDGALFLPGGGIENGETSEQALSREIQEELGCDLLRAEFLARADEFAYSAKDDSYYFFPSEFYRIEAAIEGIRLSDGEHLVCWAGMEQAAGRMARASHAWVLGQLC